MSVVVFDPYDAAFRADPYPTYQRLREEDPVHLTEAGAWVVSRHADCSRVLSDPRFGVQAPPDVREQRRAMSPPPLSVLGETMLFRDPPDHTRLRDVVADGFLPRAVERMRPHIELIIDELLDAMEAKGTIDLVADFAHPLPVNVICDLLDLPHSDRGHIQNWSRDLAGVVDIPLDPEVVRVGAEAADALIAYFRDECARRRGDRTDNLLSLLANSDDLSEDELVATCVQLLFGGHETTQNLIASGVLALLHHPDELDRLRADPTLMRSAIEEFLRYDGPGQLGGRWARQGVEIGGRMIEAGRAVYVLIGSGNRDPDVYRDPDRLDVGRTPNRHLGFGGGVHFCLGAPLARLETRIAFDALLKRFPRIEAAGEPVQRPTFALRGLASLPVTLRR